MCTLSFVWKYTPSWHGRCLSGHRLCCDVAVVLIASIAITISKSGPCDTFFLETGNWRSTGLEMRGFPYHPFLRPHPPTSQPPSPPSPPPPSCDGAHLGAISATCLVLLRETCDTFITPCHATSMTLLAHSFFTLV